MDYAATHAKALRKIRDKGAPVVFIRYVPGTMSEVTDRFTEPSEVRVPGSAVEIPGDPEEYVNLELILSQPSTLLFAPDTYGARPEAEMTIDWAGVTKTVKYVFPFQPAGTPFMARVLVV